MQFRLVIFCFFSLLPILAQPDTPPALLPSPTTDPKAANVGPALPPDLTIEIPLLVGSLEQAQQLMDGIYHELEGKLTQWEQQVKKYHEEVKQLEQQLRRVGQKWKQAENNKEKERYHQEFQRLYHRYSMVLRYQQNYLRVYANHRLTLLHIQQWRSVLQELHKPLEKFSPKHIKTDSKVQK